MLRRQLPVYSPLSARAVASGVVASLIGGTAARRTVRGALRKEWKALDLMLTDSGTSALSLALRAVVAERQDRPVAIPSYCCYDVATAVVGANVPAVTYDLDPDTLGPDPESLRDAVRAGVGAVVVAHLYGIPVDLSPVLDLCEPEGIPVVEDAAQSAGGRYRGRRLGSFGSLSVLSFGRGKGTTGCGGGALLANDEAGVELLARAERWLTGRPSRGLAQIAGAVGQWLLGRPALFALPANLPFLDVGETVYREPVPPRSISALSAGTLRTSFRYRSEELRARRRVARRWESTLRLAGGLRAVTPPEESEPGYLRFPVLAAEEAAPRLRSEEAKALGVMPGYPEILDDLPAMRSRLIRSDSRPGAEALTSRLFTLPTHSLLSGPDVSDLESLLRAAPNQRSSSGGTPQQRTPLAERGQVDEHDMHSGTRHVSSPGAA